MVKRARRLVTGRCEVARICSGGEHTQAMSVALWTEWRSSDKLSAVLKAARSDDPPSVEELMTRITAVKRVSSDSLPNLRACIIDACMATSAARALRVRAAVAYDAQNPTHEEGLETLWQLLLPGQTRQGGRMSKDWGRIGFQQADPASDFRSAGVLALDQLIYIARTRTSIAQRMIVEPSESEQRYPWACVGINLTKEMLRVVGEGWLDRALLGRPLDSALEVVHSTHADMFEILHRRWVEANPENLLAFPPIFKDVMKDIDNELQRTGGLVPPASLA